MTLQLAGIKINTALILTVPTGIGTKHDGSTALNRLLTAKALLGGPSRLNLALPQFTLLGQHSREQLKGCMEACQQSALLAQTSSWLHQLLPSSVPWGFLRSAGSGVAATLQSVEIGKLVRSDT